MPAGSRASLNTQMLLSHGPTNAHGGVNFNRVRANRLGPNANMYGPMGMGWPAGFMPKAKVYGQHGAHGWVVKYCGLMKGAEPTVGTTGFDGRAVWTNQALRKYSSCRPCKAFD